MSKLFDKIYGCEAAGTIANSMGDPVEGMTYQQIEEKYGFLEEMVSQKISFNDRSETQLKCSGQLLGPKWVRQEQNRPAGTTEDGMERHRLCTSAILKKNGRIDVVDLAKTWLEDIDPAKFGFLLGPQDQVIYYSIKAGIPPWNVGQNAAWPAMIGTTKMIQPIGMVNACDPETAAKDALDIGRIKDVRGVTGNYALEVCAAVAAATAEALKPNATVDSIIEVALSNISHFPQQEVFAALDKAKNADSWKDMREFYAQRYQNLRISEAVEMLSAGLTCLWLGNGQPKETITYAVNLGRDTDCKAYIGGGLAGALNGISSVPSEWVDIVERVTAKDPWTVSTRTQKEAAEGLYKAALNTQNQRNEVSKLFQEMV